MAFKKLNDNTVCKKPSIKSGHDVYSAPKATKC